jgi:hypothetical protein
MDPFARLSFRLNGLAVFGLAGQTILEAAAPHCLIPTLCGDQVLPPDQDCGLCVVEAPALGGLVRACSTPVGAGLEILTFSPAVRRARLEALRHIVRGHGVRCLTCPSSSRCRLQALCRDLHLASLGPAAAWPAPRPEPRPELTLVGNGPARWMRPGAPARLALVRPLPVRPLPVPPPAARPMDPARLAGFPPPLHPAPRPAPAGPPPGSGQLPPGFRQ